jgi:hypothetical protein
MGSEIKKDGAGCERKAWHPVAKVIGVVLGILIVAFVGITALGYYWPSIQEYQYEMEAERFMEEIRAEKARIQALEEADTFGGKTPEETFDMFLAALTNGDAELASKYYEVTIQEVALSGLQKELAEKGNLDLSIKYFTDVRGGEKKCNDGGDGCVFEIEVEKGFKSISLTSENYHNLWKITQPY